MTIWFSGVMWCVLAPVSPGPITLTPTVATVVHTFLPALTLIQARADLPPEGSKTREEGRQARIGLWCQMGHGEPPILRFVIEVPAWGCRPGAAAIGY